MGTFVKKQPLNPLIFCFLYLFYKIQFYKSLKIIKKSCAIWTLIIKTCLKHPTCVFGATSKSLSNYRHDFALEKFEKVKILDCHIWLKVDKTHLQGLKNLKKNIFNVLEANVDENLILKKKSLNWPINTEIFDIFEILKLV